MGDHEQLKNALQEVLQELLKPLTSRIEEIDCRTKDINSRLNKIDHRTAFLFESSIRHSLREQFGFNFVKEFTASDTCALLKISSPQSEYTKENGFVTLFRDQESFLEVWGTDLSAASPKQNWMWIYLGTLSNSVVKILCWAIFKIKTSHFTR